MKLLIKHTNLSVSKYKIDRVRINGNKIIAIRDHRDIVIEYSLVYGDDYMWRLTACTYSFDFLLEDKEIMILEWSINK